MANGEESPFWVTRRNYAQYGGVGAAWIQGGPGLPNITREARDCALEDLNVGEVDIECAAIQCVKLKVQEKCKDVSDVAQVTAPMERYCMRKTTWRGRVGEYYEIDEDTSKKLFTRAHTGGSLKPGPSNGVAPR